MTGLRVLAVDDDPMTRRAMTSVIESAGWTPVVVADPEDAVNILMAPDAPPIALIDWQMPKLSGIELCRQIRQAEPDARPYLIFVTANTSSDDIVTGLDAGADGYMTKPISAVELQARVRAGLRTIAVQSDLRHRLRACESFMTHVKPLREPMPVCVYCHRVRHEGDEWSSLEEYLTTKIKVRFTHGFCPTCYIHHVKPDLEDQSD